MKTRVLAIIVLVVVIAVVVSFLYLNGYLNVSPTNTKTMTSKSSSVTNSTNELTTSSSTTQSTGTSGYKNNTQSEITISPRYMIIDRQDAVQLANSLTQSGVYSQSELNSLQNGYFVIIKASVTNNEAQNFTLYPSSFELVTNNGSVYSYFILQHSSSVSYYYSFNSLLNTNYQLAPLFLTATENITLGYQVTANRDLIFLIPLNTTPSTLRVVDNGKIIGQVSLVNVTTDYLKVIKVNTFTNDSEVSLSLNSASTIYTINDTITLSLNVQNSEGLMPLTVTKIGVYPSAFSIIKISPDIVNSTLTPGQYSVVTGSSFPRSQNVIILVKLPNESYNGNVNVFMNVTYKPSFQAVVTQAINDRAEALLQYSQGGPGQLEVSTYLVANLSIMYNGSASVAFNPGNIYLVTNKGIYSNLYGPTSPFIYLYAVTNHIPYINTIVDGQIIQGQVAFQIPLGAKPLYIIYVSENNQTLFSAPIPSKIYNFSIFAINYEVNNQSLAYVYGTPYHFISYVYGISGGNFTINLQAYKYSYYQNSIVEVYNISLSPSIFEILSISPNLIGRYLNTSPTYCNITIGFPNQSFYGQLTINVYVKIVGNVTISNPAYIQKIQSKSLLNEKVGIKNPNTYYMIGSTTSRDISNLA
ncbi:hypothetical protein [Sulfolobus acidocaldarius]|uniref:hypothetical protein n=1 Tax=Sulfolobus acidocaldarius TaxID=2285 RepID=UPI000B5A6B28|nr:hypothetical protein [Sulfolobus acidocaldarius]